MYNGGMPHSLGVYRLHRLDLYSVFYDGCTTMEQPMTHFSGDTPSVRWRVTISLTSVPLAPIIGRGM